MVDSRKKVSAISAIAIAAGRRDGKSLARAGIGLAQFVVIVGAWIGYTVAVTAAVGAITRGVMESLMGVTSWKAWGPWKTFDVQSITDAGFNPHYLLDALTARDAPYAHFSFTLPGKPCLIMGLATVDGDPLVDYRHVIMLMRLPVEASA